MIIYDPQNNGQDDLDMYQNNTDILAVYVQQRVGVILFTLANDTRTRVNLSIGILRYDPGNSNRGGIWGSSRAVIIFVIISVSVLVSLCITCLLVYYCRRRRTRSTKNRLENRLLNAAKKALNKIPLITVKEGTRMDESCVICLDAIKVGDTVRQIGMISFSFSSFNPSSSSSLWAYISSELCRSLVTCTSTLSAM